MQPLVLQLVSFMPSFLLHQDAKILEVDDEQGATMESTSQPHTRWDLGFQPCSLGLAEIAVDDAVALSRVCFNRKKNQKKLPSLNTM
jgi:hypothetical protein